jgi:hypothetical protein
MPHLRDRLFPIDLPTGGELDLVLLGASAPAVDEALGLA